MGILTSSATRALALAYAPLQLILTGTVAPAGVCLGGLDMCQGNGDGVKINVTINENAKSSSPRHGTPAVNLFEYGYTSPCGGLPGSAKADAECGLSFSGCPDTTPGPLTVIW